MNRKGFTLIEILAVVVILGLIMMIAIPAASRYIEKSRRTTYITQAKEFISQAADEIATGKLIVRDTNTTYYIHIANLYLEGNSNKSSFGEWIDAYVIVVIDSKNNFDYYWTSVDTAGMRVDITEQNELSVNSIYHSDNKTISTTTKVDGHNKIVIFDKSGNRIAR